MPKKIKIKNTVPHLLEAVCRHADCPNWLKCLIWEGIYNASDVPADSAEDYALMLKHAPTRQDELSELKKQTENAEAETSETKSGETEFDNLAVLLSGVLNNPKLPPNLKVDFKDALCEFTNTLPTAKNIDFFNLETSPEYLARLFKIAEAEDE